MLPHGIKPDICRVFGLECGDPIAIYHVGIITNPENMFNKDRIIFIRWWNRQDSDDPGLRITGGDTLHNPK